MNVEPKPGVSGLGDVGGDFGLLGRPGYGLPD